MALAPLAKVWPKADWLPRRLRARTLLTNLSLEPAAAYVNTLSLCRPPLRRQLLSADLVAQLNGHIGGQQMADAVEAAPGDALGGMIAADVAMLLPDDFLVNGDRASIAHGLEVRPPLLDHELLELAARIPARWKIHRGETKWIFKQAYQKELPQSVVQRRKQGFEIPIDDWLRGSLREMFEGTVLQADSSVADLVNQDVIGKLYRAHLAGTGRHGNVLWSLLVLARWADRYLSKSTQAL